MWYDIKDKDGIILARGFVANRSSLNVIEEELLRYYKYIKTETYLIKGQWDGSEKL